MDGGGLTCSDRGKVESEDIRSLRTVRERRRWQIEGWGRDRAQLRRSTA